MKNLPTILLDFDGTLAQTEDLKGQTMQIYMDKLKVKNWTRTPGDSSVQVILKNLTPIVGPEKALKMAQEFNIFQAEFVSQNLDQDNAFYDDVVPFLKFLEKHNFQKTIVTTSSRNLIMALNEKINLEQYFDLNTVVTKSDIPVGSEKPSPVPYQQACNFFNQKPQDCFAVEDSKTGLKSSIATGCKTILINRDLKNFSEFSNDILLEINSLAQFQDFLTQEYDLSSN